MAKGVIKKNDKKIINKKDKITTKQKDKLYKKYNQLFNENINNRDKLVNYIELFLKDIFKDYLKNILKRNLNKLVQFCLKKGSKNQREKIENYILTKNFRELIFSKYGCFLIKKILKTTLNKKTILYIKDFMVNSFDNLFSNVYSLKTLHFFLECQSINKQQIFLETNLKKMEGQEKLVNEIINHILLKGYFQLSSIQYFIYYNKTKIGVQSFYDIFEQIKDKIHLVLKYSKINGILFLGTVFENLDFQTQKWFIKMIFKTKFNKYYEINENLIILILKIFIMFKDNNYLKKSIINVIKKDILDIKNNPNYDFLNTIIKGDYQNYMNNIINIKSENNLKVNSFLTDNLFKNKEKLIRKLIIDDEFIQNILNLEINQNLLKTNFKFNLLVLNVLENFIFKSADYTKELNSFLFNLNEFILKEIEIKEELGILNSSFGHRFIKKLVILISEIEIDEIKEIGNNFLENLFKNFKKDISFIINNKSVFIIIAIIEKTDYSDSFKNYLSNIKSLNLKKLKGKGIDILKKLIK